MNSLYIKNNLFVERMKATGNPIKPKHYEGSIEPIDLIESQGLDFNEGNVIKYVSRHKKKNGLEDLLKARFYLERLIINYKDDKTT